MRAKETGPFHRGTLLLTLYGSGSLALAHRSRLFIEFPPTYLGQHSTFLTDTLETTQRHLERLIVSYANIWHAHPSQTSKYQQPEKGRILTSAATDCKAENSAYVPQYGVHGGAETAPAHTIASTAAGATATMGN
jgi:hypothetical protein